MKKQPTLKKVTLDTLAAMVQRGFLETAKKADGDARFELVDDRFGQIDKRFELVSARFDQVDGRLDHMDKRLDHVDGRLAHIDARLATIEHDIRDLVSREEFTDLMARVKYLEVKLGIKSGK